jgi:RAD51-like protein 2
MFCCCQVALIVLDSATFHFRQAFPDAGQRSRLMTSMAQQLAALAEQHGVAVVMMNQVCERASIQFSSMMYTSIRIVQAVLCR